VFINVTGKNGLTTYSALPHKWKTLLINAFKRNPKAIIGITKSHLIIHSIKILHKHGIISIVLPFATIAIGMSALPEFIVWAILITASGYLFIAITWKSNKQRKEKNYA
jgi:hypothetical protein